MIRLQFREITGVVSATVRPYFLPDVQRLCHPHLDEFAERPPGPQLMKFLDVLALRVDVAALQRTSTKLVAAQYRDVMQSSTLKLFENIGELFLFMQDFKPQEYLSRGPKSADILMDAHVMRSWLRDLHACNPVAHAPLLQFDLSTLQAGALAVAEPAVEHFMRLVRSFMERLAHDTQVRALPAPLARCPGGWRGHTWCCVRRGVPQQRTRKPSTWQCTRACGS